MTQIARIAVIASIHVLVLVAAIPQGYAQIDKLPELLKRRVSPNHDDYALDLVAWLNASQGDPRTLNFTASAALRAANPKVYISLSGIPISDFLRVLRKVAGIEVTGLAAGDPPTVILGMDTEFVEEAEAAKIEKAFSNVSPRDQGEFQIGGQFDRYYVVGFPYELGVHVPFGGPMRLEISGVSNVDAAARLAGTGGTHARIDFVPSRGRASGLLRLEAHFLDVNHVGDVADDCTEFQPHLLVWLRGNSTYRWRSSCETTVDSFFYADPVRFANPKAPYEYSWESQLHLTRIQQMRLPLATADAKTKALLEKRYEYRDSGRWDGAPSPVADDLSVSPAGGHVVLRAPQFDWPWGVPAELRQEPPYYFAEWDGKVKIHGFVSITNDQTEVRDPNIGDLRPRGTLVGSMLLPRLALAKDPIVHSKWHPVDAPPTLQGASWIKFGEIYNVNPQTSRITIIRDHNPTAGERFLWSYFLEYRTR